MQNDSDIKDLFTRAPEIKARARLRKRALRRARQQTGQRDALTFLLVKIWAALATAVAPFFAALSEKQALTAAASSHGEVRRERPMPHK